MMGDLRRKKRFLLNDRRIIEDFELVLNCWDVFDETHGWGWVVDLFLIEGG
jgi:hypothetical protein